MNGLQEPRVPPAAEVLPDVLPGRQVVGQIAPLTAGAGLVENGVPDLADRIGPRATGLAAFGLGNGLLKQLPLFIGQVAGIGWACHTRTLPQRHFLYTLLGLTMASCSYALALAVKSVDALASVLNSVTLPMMLLSGILLPLTLAPAWLRGIAALNPLAYAVNATRALLRGQVGDTAVLQGTALLAALAVLAIGWAARSFRHATV
jgi:ABC-type polysaccharide/polyol phosphate export permease